jgi:hypothetical protein
MLRRVAEVLGATLSVEIKRKKRMKQTAVAERKSDYKAKRKFKGKRWFPWKGLQV